MNFSSTGSTDTAYSNQWLRAKLTYQKWDSIEIIVIVMEIEME
jgi:hypothetical protein